MKKKQVKQHTKLEERLLNALSDVCFNADEDCPGEYRSRHFRDSLKEGFELLKQEGKVS